MILYKRGMGYHTCRQVQVKMVMDIKCIQVLEYWNQSMSKLNPLLILYQIKGIHSNMFGEAALSAGESWTKIQDKLLTRH